jgi:hypothetical protein
MPPRVPDERAEVISAAARNFSMDIEKMTDLLERHEVNKRGPGYSDEIKNDFADWINSAEIELTIGRSVLGKAIHEASVQPDQEAELNKGMSKI